MSSENKPLTDETVERRINDHAALASLTTEQREALRQIIREEFLEPLERVESYLDDHGYEPCVDCPVFEPDYSGYEACGDSCTRYGGCDYGCLDVARLICSDERMREEDALRTDYFDQFARRVWLTKE